MEFRNLSQVPLSTLTRTFNQAFYDYVIPMSVSEAQLRENMRRDGIDTQLAVGAFDEGDLVGVILQGTGEWQGIKTAYNGGTGVIPKFRGNRITQKLYAYSLPRLQKLGVQQCLLEVITNNPAALKTYQTIGFKQSRLFTCYKAELTQLKHGEPAAANDCKVREVSRLEESEVSSFLDFSPSWQYSCAALKRLGNGVRYLGLFRETQLIGYASMIRSSNRLAQIAVTPEERGKGLGRLLLKAIAEKANGPLSIINVDAAQIETNRFLTQVGFQPTLNQYEMIFPFGVNR